MRARLVVDEIYGQETIINLPTDLHDPRVAQLEEELAQERLAHSNTLTRLQVESYRRLPLFRWIFGGWRRRPGAW